MVTRSKRPGPNKQAEKTTRQQLEHVLASATFQQVDRLKRFLSFIVLEALSGRSDQLKEYTVGVQVFGKDESFDPRTDPIVRVQARRLRARLDRYYRDEGGNDDLVIDLPKGGYAPVFKQRMHEAAARRPVSVSLMSRNTVAVLAFADHTPAGDLAYFCKGLRQEIIHRLARVKSLRVLAWDLSESNHTGSPKEILSRLNAGMIVGGSVRRAGDKLRITTHLIDGETGCYQWSESIEARADDTLAAQSAVAQAVVNTIATDHLEAGPGKGLNRPTTNLASHNLYLQGRYHLNQRTEEGLQKAAEFFEKAIVEDGQNALAHSGLSDAYGLLAHYGVLGPAEVWAKAASSAATAVMLDGNSAEARTSLAHVKATQDWDWMAAQEEYLRAISLDYRYPTLHHWYAMSCLVPLERLDEALEEMQLAQSLDPVSSIIARDLAVIHYYRRDFEAALDQCDHTIELNPYFSPAYRMLGQVQEQRGDVEEATAALQRAAHLSPHSQRIQAALGRLLAVAGKRKPALEVVANLGRLAKTRYVSPFEFVPIYFALGQIDTGFEWLTKACQDRCFEMLSIKVDPRFDSLRGDSRFTAILKQVGLD